MISPARRHREKVLAAKHASNVTATPDYRVRLASDNIHDRMASQLAGHDVELKALQSVKSKIEKKREFVPLYDAYIDGVLEAGEGAQDFVLSSLMVWNIDIGDYWRALDIARYVLAHDIKLPEKYDRDAATLLVEEIAEGVAAHMESTGDDMWDEERMDLIAMLGKLIDMTEDRDMPDEVRAKAHKTIGMLLIDFDADDNLANGIPHLARAFELNPKSGVKTTLARARKDLAKREQASAENDTKSASANGESKNEKDSSNG